MIKLLRWGLQPRLTVTVNCNLQSCLLFTESLKSRSLRTSLMMEIGSCNLFSDMSCHGPNIHLVRIGFSLHSKHWKLRHLWVSMVHGWAGVAGHLVESLSRICHVRFMHSSCSSLDRSWWCKSYFRIWKHRLKHTTRQYQVQSGW